MNDVIPIKPRKKMNKPMKWILMTLALFSTLILGVGIGGASAGLPQPAKTVTVVKRVPVPGPTKVVPGPATVKVKHVLVTPPACLTALTLSERVAGDAKQGFGIVRKYLPLIQEAYLAGMNGTGVDSVVAKMKSNTEDVRSLTQVVRADATRYREMAMRCRLHGTNS